VSYEQAMKHSRTKRHSLNVGHTFNTGSGFWPSKAMLDDYSEYQQDAKDRGVAPVPFSFYHAAKHSHSSGSLIDSEEKRIAGGAH